MKTIREFLKSCYFVLGLVALSIPAARVQSDTTEVKEADAAQNDMEEIRQALAAPDANAKTCVPQSFGFQQSTPYQAVEVLPDGRVTFRICAPDAQDVRTISSDLPGIVPSGVRPGTPAGLTMIRDATGIWSTTTERSIAADTYRFAYRVDGVKTPDPMGATWSEERSGIDSVFEVPGSEGEFQSYNKDIQHGTVSEIEYWSESLGIKRRAHVYTPPGYMNNRKKYPVLYLVHGAGDSDDSWTSVGRAHYIVDNLLAEDKVQPMIIVMPNGHTPPQPGTDMLNNTGFGNDLIKDLMPYVEANFRTINKADARAMAGLSMGGAHTIQNGLTHPELFTYIGVFSMGLGAFGGAEEVTQYEQTHDAALRKGAKDLKLVYYAMGKEDFLYATVAHTRGILDKYGIEHVYNESPGGHTWINWRRYLEDFAPRLFQ